MPGHAFQERHYREFVSFLPHVQRFLYGDAPGPVRGLGNGDAPLRVYRRTDIAAVRMVLSEGAAPVTCHVAHVDLHFFHDVDAVILAVEFCRLRPAALRRPRDHVPLRARLSARLD